MQNKNIWWNTIIRRCVVWFRSKTGATVNDICLICLVWDIEVFDIEINTAEEVNV